MTAGRPSEYTQERADKVCSRIVEGMSLRKLSKIEEMPGIETIYKWLRTYPEFAEQYARAKSDQADAMAEEIMDISDNATSDNFQVARLRVDSRKWLASKFKAKKYGDATQLKLADADGNKLSIKGLYEELIDTPTSGLPKEKA